MPSAEDSRMALHRTLPAENGTYSNPGRLFQDHVATDCSEKVPLFLTSVDPDSKPAEQIISIPGPPWILCGEAVCAFTLVDVRQAASLVPERLHVITVMPGKTLGVIYLASYGAGSVVSHGWKTGFWISCIAVDNAHAVAGGREIWGLRKMHAVFDWSLSDAGVITVNVDGSLKCSFTGRTPGICVPVSLSVPVMTESAGQLLQFHGRLAARAGIARGKLDIQGAGAFTGTDLMHIGMMLHLRGMQLVSKAPKFIGVASGCCMPVPD
jgi:hypothetical protein